MPTPMQDDALASLEDVKAAYEGEWDEGRDGWALNLLARAQRLLLAQRPNVLRWVVEGRVSRDSAGDAVVAAVLRVVRNPEGMQSETEGNYLYSVQRDVAGGKLYFTGDDLALVTPSVGRQVGSIRLGLTHGPVRR